MKRKDLQGLRGIAIVAVIFFHFFPTCFPNGYLGVDLFFVLSGFLITMILHKSKITKDVLVSFYFRRVKRIVPLYYLATCTILLVVLIAFSPSFLVVNVDSMKKSLLFFSNIEESNEMNYYAELNQADNLYTHTWSLSVEMQYYLLVPFIYYAVTKLQESLHSGCFLILCAISLTYHCISDQNTAFNSVFARIWQFSIGSLVFLETIKMDRHFEDDSKNSLHDTKLGLNQDQNKHLIVSSLTSILLFSYFNWNIVDQTYMRIVTTVLAGIIMLMGSAIQSPILINSLLVYCGDISYSLYLIHWPVFVYVKTHYPDDTYACVLGITFAIAVAAFVTETYEKWYLRSQPGIIGFILVVLLILNILCMTVASVVLQQMDRNSKIILPNENNLIDVKSSQTNKSISSAANITGKFVMSQSELSALNLNKYYIKADAALLNNPNCTYTQNKPFGWCNFTTGVNPKSHLSAMILGNSYAANLGDLVWKNCGNKVNRMNQHSAVVCEPLAHTHFQKIKCYNYFPEFLKYVKQDPPDYLFLISRWIEMAKPYNGTLDTDPFFKQGNERMVEYSKVVRKKIIILHGFPTPKSGFLQVFNKRIEQMGKNAKSDDMIDPYYNTNDSRSRLEAIAKRNPKCIFIDIQKYLTWNGSFHITDDSTAISYFTGSLHVSPHGKKIIDKAFKDVCAML